MTRDTLMGNVVQNVGENARIGSQATATSRRGPMASARGDVHNVPPADRRAVAAAAATKQQQARRPID